ncbi:hypothetical protein SMI01S_12100 [Sphingobacterium mizutaii NBRC 14946 = DSM 11724]|uniref:Helix-turn-helix n=2 Tax=Sphingobacterium mizutaii TaxID=1010 RepID=A0AAJ5C0U4_9SPHI|nr:helix-turn-helix domain-containing protein [Sphingobacterium mizutaii]GEM67604.1 hypothetical protein SMI01S_12100 [Sphingobacterium mizutaii NBRC 14946 = DSM 11724]SDL15119.1 Helix-turn-helix [Sphingobacterium mizutaii]SNV52319.1 Helix-turn-helix [Sphingobacterium mizutaii]
MVIGKLNRKIDAFFTEHGISSYKVSKESGLSEPTINRYRKGESNPTDKNLSKLLKAFPDLENYILNDYERELKITNQTNQIPMYNLPAAAGEVEVYSNPEDVKIIGYLNIPGAHKESIAIPAYGHSMYPTIANGDWAVSRPISDPTEIVWGEVYYIEWSDYKMYKRLLASDNLDEVILWSDNQLDKIGDRPKYAALSIKKEKIRKLRLVTEILKKPNY